MTVQHIIDKVTHKLKGIPGIVGIVLGGSRARGTHSKNSDIDIGIYYDESRGFDANEVGKIATELDDEHRTNLVSSIGEWGEWINGGGWIVVSGYHVDLIFRDINRVSNVIDDCLSGKVSTHYHAGHPHAYLNVMYMGEISVCKILVDPTKQVTKLKAKTQPYPEPLKETIISYFMFEASFSLMFVKDNIDKDDISYVAGHCFRAISCLNQVLFALNEVYCINEKKAVRMIESFPKKPKEYKNNIDRIMTLISTKMENTSQAVEILGALFSETDMLVKMSVK